MWGTPPKQVPGITKDSLKYSYKKVDEKASDCNPAKDSLCAEIKLEYPVFPGHEALNSAIKLEFLSLDSGVYNIQQLSGSFFKSYHETRKDEPELSSYYLNAHVHVIRQDSSLTALQFGYDSFEGGAHGSTGISYINWNSKNDNKIKLDDLLIKNYKSRLNTIAEKIFRIEENLSDTASLATNYFFKDNKFALNDNFLITPLGLSFYYNNYEIKPYAAGPTTLLIPYRKIKSLLLPNTVVSQYIK